MSLPRRPRASATPLLGWGSALTLQNAGSFRSAACWQSVPLVRICHLYSFLKLFISDMFPASRNVPSSACRALWTPPTPPPPVAWWCGCLYGMIHSHLSLLLQSKGALISTYCFQARCLERPELSFLPSHSCLGFSFTLLCS